MHIHNYKKNITKITTLLFFVFNFDNVFNVLKMMILNINEKDEIYD